MYTEEQYEADCQLIDKMVVIHAGFTQDPEIIKQASIADTLGGVAQRIYKAVQDRIARDGVVATLATYLSPMVLGRIWSPLYILVPVASWFGFDIGSVFKTVIDLVKGIISSTGNFTESDAASIADQVTSNLTAAASLEPLRQLEKKGQIADAMQGKLIKSGSIKKEAINFLGLGNIFRSFGRSRVSKILFGGFLRWFIMAVLMGLALFDGPKVLGFGGSTSSGETTGFFGTAPQTGSGESSTYQVSQYNIPSTVSHSLKPSGHGEQYHANTDRTLWVVNMSGDIANTLWLWAKSIYPELASHKQEVFASRSFNRMVSVISGVNQRIGTEYFQMPPNSGLHTWKDVVDTFAGEVAASIKGK